MATAQYTRGQLRAKLTQEFLRQPSHVIDLTVNPRTGKINTSKFYVGSIPSDIIPLHEFFNIKYVCVTSRGIRVYIHEDYLIETIIKFGLYTQ